MKILFRVALFTSTVVAFASCKSSQATSEYKQFYNSIDKEHAMSFSDDEDDDMYADASDEESIEDHNDYLVYWGHDKPEAKNATVDADDIEYDSSKSRVVYETPPSPRRAQTTYSSPTYTASTPTPKAAGPSVSSTASTRSTLTAKSITENVNTVRTKVQVVNNSDYNKLRKYSVVIATLTQPKGIDALKRFLEKDGVSYFIVKSPKGYNYFVIHSADSQAEALKARTNFLIQHTVNKSREQIWQRYFVQLTDTFILEKQ